jgi:phage-related holin
MLDWITGVMKAHKLGTLSSRAMIKKFYTGSSYLVAIAAVRLCEVYFGDEIPLVKPVIAMIALSELQSMRENIQAITGVDLLKNLFNVLQRKSES